MSEHTKNIIELECPTCNTRLIWSTENPHRPFCSDRCRNKDFIAWANEENLLPGDPQYADFYSDMDS